MLCHREAKHKPWRARSQQPMGLACAAPRSRTPVPAPGACHWELLVYHPRPHQQQQK
uniref:Macaca fascicularis brain cDNA clone: QflA-19108, similar to human solute carrier family 25, (mitochondrial carrier),member 18 (SLC25A18), mRNA, RefSeq: NM_031481.1 n=1 Tax=Macaca fascicularis TaxID=9541 RepID=I7GID5_MACFA|nr:unnamed protein product [Macaca fascicularis]